MTSLILAAYRRGNQMSDRGESCELCRFFELHDEEYGEGCCRRYPPQLSPPMMNATIESMKGFGDPEDVLNTASEVKDDSSHWQWPIVSIPSEDWCGEFEHR